MNLPRVQAVSVVMLRNWLAIKRGFWVAIVTGFFEPVFYLMSIGLGVGTLIGQVTTDWGQAVPYAEFIAPAMLASTAMNGAIYDSTTNVFYKLKFAKVYDTMLAAPLEPVEVALGEIGTSLLRGQVYALGFLAVAAALGMVHSWWALLALPVAGLVGFAFGAVGMAATTFMRSWTDNEYVQLVLTPMFLLSGTMFPLSVYPGWAQPIVIVSPLYQGVELARQLMLGHVHPGLLIPVAWLLIIGVAGGWVVTRRLRSLLMA